MLPSILYVSFWLCYHLSSTVRLFPGPSRKWWAWFRFDSRWTHVALRQNHYERWRWALMNLMKYSIYYTCTDEQSGEYSHRYFEIKCHKRENTKEYTCEVESNTYAICQIPHVHKKMIFLQSNSWLSLFHKSPGGIPGDVDKWGFMRTI